MCLIIHKPKAKTKIPSHIIDNAEDSNPDGFGITFLDGDKETVKTLCYYEARDLIESQRSFVAHYRYATVGKVTEDNCHPFPVGNKGQLYSNGTVADLGDKNITDTQIVGDVLATFERKDYKAILSLTDTRFVYVHDDDSTVSRFGIWHKRDGVYYSKTNCFGKRMSTTTTAWEGIDYNNVWGEDDGGNNWIDDELTDRYEDYFDTPQSGDLVAVYGTLKAGRGNSSLLDTSSFIGQGKTLQQYPMIDTGIPYVYDLAGTGHQITVEVYEPDSIKTWQALDQLEGHPHHYERRLVEIELDNGFTEAWLYFSANMIEGTNNKPLLAEF